MAVVVVSSMLSSLSPLWRRSYATRDARLDRSAVGRGEQRDEVFLPHGGIRVRPVAGGTVARRYRDRAPFGDARNLALEDLQLRRIDDVVGEVDRDQRRLDLLEPRTRIVIARRFERVEDVVGVAAAHVVLHVGVDDRVGAGERRRLALPTDGIAADEPQHLSDGAQTLRLRRVVAVFPLRIAANGIDRNAAP